MRFLVLLSALVWCCNAAPKVKYTSNLDLLQFLRDYPNKFPAIAQAYSIGKSVKGIDLLVIKLTTSKDPLAPNVKLIGNIHGNEPVGRELLINFLRFIGPNSTTNKQIANLLDTTVLHVLPSLNPDGFANANIGICEGNKGRHNANGIDLNRNFPDYYHNNTLTLRKQPETDAIINWMNDITFSLSASLHSGALVVNYPFDTVSEYLSLSRPQPSLAPDDDVLRHLALAYAEANPSMQREQMHDCQGQGREFANGITNGAEWHSIEGGMQDYNYGFKGTMEITIELSCCKYPLSRDIKATWADNKQSLMQFWAHANRGVRGKIVDLKAHPQHENIELRVAGRPISFYPDKNGQFWRILLQGKYVLQVILERKVIAKQTFVVNNNETTTLQVYINNAHANSSLETHTQAQDTIIASASSINELSNELSSTTASSHLEAQQFANTNDLGHQAHAQAVSTKILSDNIANESHIVFISGKCFAQTIVMIVIFAIVFI